MTKKKYKKLVGRIVMLPHEDFVRELYLKHLDIYLVGKNRDLLFDANGWVYNTFRTLYLLAPPIVFVYISYKNGDAWFLIGIFLSYMAVWAAKKEINILAPALLFCIATWIKNGFSFNQYATVFFIAMVLSDWSFEASKAALTEHIKGLIIANPTLYDLLLEGGRLIVVKKRNYDYPRI